MEICPRCGTRQLQDIRTWAYIEAIRRHLCPICILQGAHAENPSEWKK